MATKQLQSNEMKVMSAPWKLLGLAGFGLEVEEYIEPLEDRVTQP